jgi:hypothetical protein
VADRGAPLSGECLVRFRELTQTRTLLGHRDIRKGMIQMSEEADKARQALQESMDLREQGHSDD